MATTENLGLNIINPSDYVSPDPFNENFQKLDTIGLDYVVEEGKSGDWWYRKWYSGRAECGVDSRNFGTVQHNYQWGALYTDEGGMSFGAYPFAFASNPFVSISYLSSQWAYAGMGPNGSTTMSPTFFYITARSGSEQNVKFGIYVNGRYK